LFICTFYLLSLGKLSNSSILLYKILTAKDYFPALLIAFEIEDIYQLAKIY